MRVTHWNCVCGDVSRRLSALAPLRSDLITLQACRRPASDSASVIWRGTIPSKAPEDTFRAEHQRNQPPPHAPISVKEWMDRLELHVNQACLRQYCASVRADPGTAGSPQPPPRTGRA